MSKADNMLAILWMLKTGRRVTAQRIAEELEIHIRTVYRYIDALCASGVPILSDPGHNGGYSLLESFTAAPLFFDLEEQKALIHAAKFAGEAGYPFGEALDRAVDKLRRYTNPEQKSRISRHEEGLEVIPSLPNAALAGVLQELETGAADGLSLQLEYHKGFGESSPTTRLIDPYGLVYWKGRWYIVAYCHLRGEIRSFRADRVRSLLRTEETFRRPENFSARSYLMKSLMPEEDDGSERVLIRIGGQAQALTDLSRHHLIASVLEEGPADELRFRVEASSVLRYLPYVLLSYGTSIRVLEPAGLREKQLALAEELAAHYRAEDPL
ncbi:WYL domain-containing protein [Paenibacillus sp. CC-CFT747]|nr:WYL domain-containing protein [Paenibacillus sp. CC-CFT747]